MIELPSLELIEANWPAIAITAALVLALLWLLLRGRRARSRDRHRAPDALDEGDEDTQKRLADILRKAAELIRRRDVDLG